MILRETQNQNDADDANDAESGIWYRDIPKTASLASSASLSSRKNSAGVWGTPQKCVCGYPNAMLAKHVYHQNGVNQTRCPYKFVYAPEWISLDSSKNLDSKKWITSDSLSNLKKSMPDTKHLGLPERFCRMDASLFFPIQEDIRKSTHLNPGVTNTTKL